VRQTAEADGYDTEIIIEQEPGSSGKALADHFVRNVLPDFRVRIVPATTKKMARAQPTTRPITRALDRQKKPRLAGTAAERAPALVPHQLGMVIRRSRRIFGIVRRDLGAK
jgi:hypothetical protein